MHSLRVDQSALFQWTAKPWSRRRISSTFPRLRALNLKKDLYDIAQYFHFGTREVFEPPCFFTFPFLAPLSEKAVLSRIGSDLTDETSFMQGHARTLKQTPHDEQQEAILDRIASGSVPTNNGESDDSSLSGSERRSSPPGEGEVPSSASSGIQPPSTAGGRQEVIMFHLDDPPIRAFLDWSDYFRMITEIAHHFATEPANVVDAYEINTDVRGLPPDAVPIIVHLFPDIAVGLQARLVLIDLEIHAHRIEPSFRLGPSTQRFVHPIPQICARHDALEALNVERYCEQEQDRCFMWLDSAWWSAEDIQPKLISHGDYIRVAVPPSERLECATSQMIEWSQNGLSDAEIRDHVVAPEASAGYSPSPLHEDEVRNLAAPSALANNIEEDAFSSMQTRVNVDESCPSVASSSSRSSTIDWVHDLARLRQLQLNSICTANLNLDDEENFLVYTWFLDHRDRHACLTPKIVTLDDTSEDWEQLLIHPWRHSLSHEEKVFLDVVLPTPPAASIEDHIAHVLITQHATTRCSVLLSVAIEGMYTRFAIAVPSEAAWTDFTEHVPLLAQTDADQVEWISPERHSTDSHLRVWPGRGLQIRLKDDRELTASTDTLVLLQQSTAEHVKTMPVLKSIQYDKQPGCSFTDEFLQAVSAAQDAATMEPPPQAILDPRTIEAQPEAFQILWEKFTDEELIATDIRSCRRVESWFLHHHSFTRCSESRISLLNDDFSTWYASFVATWNDRIVNSADLSFAVVHPATEDATTGCIAQAIVTENAQVESRSAVLSVYDSDDDADLPPRTFAIVLPRQVTLNSLIILLQIQADCPPISRRNQCSLWFGRIPIAETNVVNVQMGSAFRFVVSRAEMVDIAYLMTLDGSHIRETLQRAVHTDIHVRPPDPSFLRRGSEHLISHADVLQDGRPEWIPILQRYFDRWYSFDTVSQRSMLHVKTWYLNDHPAHHCSAAKATTISQESFMWRTDLLFAWREQLIRATPIDIDVVSGVDWDEDEEFGHVHILLTKHPCNQPCSCDFMPW